MRLFWRKGYTATSIEDLVETLQLSRSSLYGTFGDKRRLFLEALKFYSERVISGTARTLNEVPSPLAGIQALFDDLIAAVDKPSGALGCFMVNSVAELVPYDPGVSALATAYSDSLQGLLAKALTRAGRPDQATRQQTPEQLAAYVFNMIQGLRVLIKSGATREQVQAIRDITLKSLQP
jgi:TetR/AcrR family transcriptional regulator, transcriptional repressor for nem operon